MLSPETRRVLEGFSKANGDSPIDSETAGYLYAGEPSTFDELSETDQLQYALLITCASRDSVVEALKKTADERDNLVRLVHKYGNRANRRK